MFNHPRTYSMLIVGVAGVIVVEALANPFKQEESFCIVNREPDIPAENFSYSPLPHTGIVVATTSGSGYMVSSFINGFSK